MSGEHSIGREVGPGRFEIDSVFTCDALEDSCGQRMGASAKGWVPVFGSPNEPIRHRCPACTEGRRSKGLAKAISGFGGRQAEQMTMGGRRG